MKCPHCGTELKSQSIAVKKCDNCQTELGDEWVAEHQDSSETFSSDNAENFEHDNENETLADVVAVESDDANSETIDESGDVKSDLDGQDVDQTVMIDAPEEISDSADDDIQQTFTEEENIDSTVMLDGSEPEAADDINQTLIEQDALGDTYQADELPSEIDSEGTVALDATDILATVAEDGTSAKPDNLQATFVEDQGADQLQQTIANLWQGNIADDAHANTSLKVDIDDDYSLGTVAVDESEGADNLPNDSDRTIVEDSQDSSSGKSKNSEVGNDLIVKSRLFRGAESDAVSKDEADYEILKVLGEGGMGTVYLAQQTSIDRSVAVKTLKSGIAKSASNTQKFLSEAVVTGDLDHPNIVPIYDLGRNHNGDVFYSMLCVSGTPWDEVITEKSLNENLEIFMKVADAVAFAHSRGVIHRDLKPENTMLGEYGEVLVMDWGLALTTSEFKKRSVAVQAGSIGGTPAYMSPEMAKGEVYKIGPASDIYLLGAILYEIITGRPPHYGEKVMKCLLAAGKNEIVPTDKSGELVEIALKAMATAVEDRYQTVPEFQHAIRDYLSHTESIALSTRATEDLKRGEKSSDYQDYSRARFGFEEALELWPGNQLAAVGLISASKAYAECALNKSDFDLGISLLNPNQPEHAEIYSLLQQGQAERDARVHRLQAAKRIGVGLVALVLVVVSVAFIWIRAEATNARIAERLAKQAEKNALEEKKQADIARDDALTQKKRADDALVEVTAQKKIADNALMTAVKEKKAADAAKLVAIQEKKKAETEKQKAEAERKIAESERKKADAASKVAMQEQKKAEQAELKAVKEKEAADKARKVALAEKMKADIQREKAVAARKAAEQAQLAEQQAKEAEEYEAYIAEIGLAAAKIRENSFDSALQLLNSCKPQLRNWEWGRLMHLCSQGSQIFPADAPVDSVAVSQNGQQMAVGGWKGMASIYDVSSGEVVQHFKHQSLYVHAVAFSPDGKYLATGSSDKSAYVRIWDIKTGKPVRDFKGHTDAVLSLQFSKDGKRLLSSSFDHTARIWDISSGEQIRKLLGHTWWVWSAKFCPEPGDRPERKIATSSQDGTVIVWTDNTGLWKNESQIRQSPPFRGHQGPVYSVAFAPDGKSVASAGNDRRLLLWNPEEITAIDYRSIVAGGKSAQTPFVELTGHTDAIRTVTYSQDGTLLLTGSHDNTIKVWSVEQQKAIKTFRGHASWVRSAVFSPDGRWIVSGSHDNTSRKWHIAQYEEIRVLQGRALQGHIDAVLAATFSPDGKNILTASRDRTARLWSYNQGVQNKTFSEGHAYLASAALFSQNEKRLFTAAVDNTVRMWDVTTGTEMIKLNQTGRGAALALSHDDNYLATGGDQNQVQIWDVRQLKQAADNGTSGVPVHVLRGHQSEVCALAISPDGQTVVSGDSSGNLRSWSMKTGKLLHQMVGHSDKYKIVAISFLPNGKQILSASEDNTVGQWIIETGKELRSAVLKHPDAVISMALTPDGKTLFTSALDHQIRQWDIAQSELQNTFSTAGQELQSLTISHDGKWLMAVNSNAKSVELFSVSKMRSPLSSAGTRFLDFKLQGGQIWAAVFSPDSLHVLTLGGNEAKLWNRESSQPEMTFSPHGAVASANFSPDAKKIVTASWDNSAKIWDSHTGKAIHKLEDGHTSYVNDAIFTADGQHVLTASDDGTAKLWDVKNNRVLKAYNGHTAGIWKIALSPDGSQFLTASQDKTARLWDAKTGKQLMILKGHTWGVLCATFSYDGKLALTGSDDNTARIWDLQTGKSLKIMSGHTARVTSVAFSPDGLRVLTASADNTAKLWDASTGQEILSLTGHQREITSITFSPDGKTVLTGSRDGKAILWLTADWKKTSRQVSQFLKSTK